MAIGTGAPYWAKAFAEAQGVDFPLYSDPGSRTFDAFGLRRNAADFLTPKALGNLARAIRRGHKQGKTQGNPLQNGGVIIFSADAKVVFAHVEATSGDLVDLDAMMKGVAQAVSPNP